MTQDSQHTCLLCESSNVAVREIIKAQDVIKAYRRSFDIPIKPATFSLDLRYVECSDCGLHFFSPDCAGDEDLYARLQRFDWYYQSDKEEYPSAATFLPINGRVLEVGAGKGAFARYVGRERYIGLEFNDAALKRAATEGLTLRKQSVEEHSTLHAGEYAAVVSFQVLEHVSSPARFIRACVAALAPDGVLVLAVPNHDGVCGLAQNNILDIPPHHVTHWNGRTLKRVADQFGLELIAVEREPLSPMHEAWAERALVERRLRNVLGFRSSVFDPRISSRMLGRIAGVAARVVRPPVVDVAGHTILAAYRKQSL